MRAGKFIHWQVVCFLCVVFWGCSDPVIPGGRVIIRNDVLGKDYNSFVIDSVRTKAGLQGFRKSLSPGDEVILPFKNVRALRVSRQYSDHTKVYHVECPSDLNVQVQMKLIDIHTNRLQGGCVLRKRGERARSGIMTWDDE